MYHLHTRAGELPRSASSHFVMRFWGDFLCQKRKISLSPLENYELSISLSLLKIGEQDLAFLFLFSKTEILFSLSLSLLKA